MTKSLTQIYSDYIEPIRQEWPEEATEKEAYAHYLGDLGEVFAIDYLLKEGFTLCRADKIDFLGHSLVSGENSIFDCTIRELNELAKQCNETFMCSAEDAPCKSRKSDFFQFNPDAAKSCAPGSDGHFSCHCAHKLSYTAILEDQPTFGPQGKFIQHHLQIHNYILNCLDHAGTLEGADLMYKPGRLDFFAYKDERYYCLDSKVNTASLSKWQRLRAAWMQQFGYFSGVIRVRFDAKRKDFLVKEFENKDFNTLYKELQPQIAFEEFKNTEDCSANLPSSEQLSITLRKGYHAVNPNDDCFYWEHYANGKSIVKIPADYRKGETNKINPKDIIGPLRSDKDCDEAWSKSEANEDALDDSEPKDWIARIKSFFE